MNMEDFVTMLAGIKDDKKVLIPYQLDSKGQLRKLIQSLGSPIEAFNYFTQISKAEAAIIKENI